MQRVHWVLDCGRVQAVLPPTKKHQYLTMLPLNTNSEILNLPIIMEVLTLYSGVVSIFWFDQIPCPSPTLQCLPQHPLDCRVCPWQNHWSSCFLNVPFSFSSSLASWYFSIPLSTNTIEPVVGVTLTVTSKCSLSFQKNPSCSEAIIEFPFPSIRSWIITGILGKAVLEAASYQWPSMLKMLREVLDRAAMPESDCSGDVIK